MAYDIYEEYESFISYLRFEQRSIWRSISKADDEGFLSIDEENDTIRVTTELSRTYPELYYVINMLIRMWSGKKSVLRAA